MVHCTFDSVSGILFLYYHHSDYCQNSESYYVSTVQEFVLGDLEYKKDSCYT